MARPSPVPPYLLVDISSSWENETNSLDKPSAVIPKPVSLTEKWIRYKMSFSLYVGTTSGVSS